MIDVYGFPVDNVECDDGYEDYIDSQVDEIIERRVFGDD